MLLLHYRFKLWIVDRYQCSLTQLPEEEPQPQSSNTDGRHDCEQEMLWRKVIARKRREQHPQKIDDPHYQNQQSDKNKLMWIALQVSGQQKEKRRAKVKKGDGNNDCSPRTVYPYQVVLNL